jgi:hypothetical protein
MKTQAIKLEITNSRNDSKGVQWFFCDTDEEKKEWINKKKKEEDKWNYHTPGAVSMRFYNFDEYLTSNLMEMDISELEGMKLKNLIEIIKACL